MTATEPTNAEIAARIADLEERFGPICGAVEVLEDRFAMLVASIQSSDDTTTDSTTVEPRYPARTVPAWLNIDALATPDQIARVPEIADETIAFMQQATAFYATTLSEYVAMRKHAHDAASFDDWPEVVDEVFGFQRIEDALDAIVDMLEKRFELAEDDR